MKVIVAGSREFTDKEAIRDEMNKAWREWGPFEVVSGMARGVDRLAAEIAREAGITVHEFPADWDRYGRSAGYRRNEKMAQVADGLIAFWQDGSRGTRHMIDLAREYDLLEWVLMVGDNWPSAPETAHTIAQCPLTKQAHMHGCKEA